MKEYLLKYRDIEAANFVETKLNNSEDYNPAEWSGFNYDDSYDLGRKHGRAELIEILIKLLEENDNS